MPYYLQDLIIIEKEQQRIFFVTVSSDSNDILIMQKTNGHLGCRYAKGVLQSFPPIAVARMKLTITINSLDDGGTKIRCCAICKTFAIEFAYENL